MLQTTPIPRRSKLLYIVIFCILLAGIVIFVAVRGINGSLSPDTTNVQQQDNTPNNGTTGDTEGAADSTGTPSDRSVPSSTGSDGNSLLNQSQQ